MPWRSHRQQLSDFSANCRALMGPRNQWVMLQWVNDVLIYGMGHRSMGGVMCYESSHGWGHLLLGHSLWGAKFKTLFHWRFLWLPGAGLALMVKSVANRFLIRKILVSVKFVSAILGPEMAAPILWAPGKMRPFCRKNHVHKISRFRGGVFWVWGGGGGGSADFIFMGARIFLTLPFSAKIFLVTRPKYPPLSRDRRSNTPVALCFLWYRRLSLLHPHFCP